MPNVDEPTSMNEALSKGLDLLEALNARQDRSLRIPTGFEDLDVLLGGGLSPGTLTVVASRPAVGTTTLLNDFCRSAALRNNLPTFMVSYESLLADITLRVTSAEARVALHAMRRGAMTDEEWARVAKAMEKTAEAPLHIATPADWTVAQLCEQITRMHAEYRTRLVTVDGLHAVRPDIRSDTREREVTEIAQELKAVAMRLGIAVVVAARFNRQLESRPDKIPSLYTDLRDSGAVAHIADLVILLHREDVYDPESPRAGEADLIVAKHRHGPAATAVVAFQGHYGRFVDMAPAYRTPVRDLA
ncbi:DnaB-like helicase C-terminal domain-containing protein [Planomonospora sp. ID82291]|uniref:replicative DNA helicase n=1 Tax=Planomonospora sp. ID82291 TaxID=2738136 RepID=UPI0018C3BD13|nr:DnaB-like helicase C-terminal domain-containing protein [Planomonospora sp. ID82291]MBG0818360.1 AAA family ATPase [Planomonospora sp. ID82291]